MIKLNYKLKPLNLRSGIIKKKYEKNKTFCFKMARMFAFDACQSGKHSQSQDKNGASRGIKSIIGNGQN